MKNQIKKILKEEITAKGFMEYVDDEWDIETLELLMSVLQERIGQLQGMQDVLNPRQRVKGFKSYDE